MSRDNSAAAQFAIGLKTRSQQNKTSRDLLVFIKTELREMSQDEYQAFFDDFNHQIIEMISSNDVVEKKGGVLAIKCLINGEAVNTTASVSRYLNNLRCLFPCGDANIMELAARTLVKLGQLPGAKGAESFEYEIKKAFEFISEDKNDGKRHAAVIILRELATANPTFFYQHVSSFFDHIFTAIRDPKSTIREGAGEALRAALIVTSQRESVKSTTKPTWYKQCYDEAMYCFGEFASKEKGYSKDDRVHGALIVLNEILRCSNSNWEKKYLSLKRLHPEQHKPTEDSSNIFPTFKSQLSYIYFDKFGYSSNRNSNFYPNRSYPFDFDTDSKFSRQHLSINESATCRQIVLDNYDEICLKVLQQRHLKTSFVQQSLLNILPRLAAFNREEFVAKHLRTIIDFLLITLRNKEKDRSIAFVTLGFIAVAVEKNIANERYIEKIMEVIKASMPAKDSTKKKLTPIDPSVFKCITLLGHSVKNGISKDVKDILEPMFSTGLTPGLTICLRELANNIPNIKRDISDLLLKMLSTVLLTKAQPQQVTPSKHIPAPFSSLNTSNESQQDIAVIVLALKTLGTFHFEGQNLLLFVQRCADDFLTYENQEIRIEAVQTCSSLLKTSIQQSMESGGISDTLKETICHVLEKLLVAGVTDIDSNVRLRVLKSLDETFDAQLAQPWFLSSLLVTLNDEVFEIRELAIITIGRLSAMNPAYVMPSLRKTLVQLLTELEHSGMSRNKEQSARMLDHLILNTPRLISSYMRPILTILVPKLKESEANPAVVLNILQAIGDLAEVTGGSNVMEFYAEDLLAILIEMLSDSSAPNKRRVALWSLGQLVTSTGQVVTPYNTYPHLIDILINFLKTDNDMRIRRETIRVLGLLGALDPYKHKLNRGLVDNQNDSILISYSDIKIDEYNDLSTAELLVNMGNALEEYYPAVAISTLMKILRDPNLSHHHMMVVQAVTFIFTNLGIKCVPYLSQVLPNLINNIRGAEVSSRDFLFTQLSILIEIVKQHIIGYMDEIFKLVKDFWIPTSEPIQLTLINLVEKISISLGCEFRVYLSELMPQILKVLSHDNSKNRGVTIQLLTTIRKFGDNLDDYLHLILPPIVKLFDPFDFPHQVCVEALRTIKYLAEILDFTDYSSRIIHPLVRVLDNHSELRNPAMETLCSLMIQLGRGYLIFVPMVNKILLKHKINNLEYNKILGKIQSPTTLPLDDELRMRQAKYKSREPTTITAPDSTIKKLPIQENRLQVQSLRRVSKDDWIEWLKTLSIGLLKESQSPAIRACQALAQNYPPLLRDLFNAAFISCWTELSTDKRNQLAESLKQALMVPDLPEITQTILNLAEFMEHCEKSVSLMIDAKSLGERAMESRAYAKALHYKEVEFREEKSHQVIESLILINNKLQQKEAAKGLLDYVMAHPELKIQIRWYEKLHDWEKALELYQKVEVPDTESCLGQMRCLEALGEWSELSELANNEWEAIGNDGQSRAGRLAAVASWGLQDFEKMEEYVKCIPEDTQDGSFYRAVLAVHHGNYELCQKLIDQTRFLLDTELTAMASESYERAYGAMVCVQMLAELEEVIQYKLIPERRDNIKDMWWKRLRGGQRLVEDWQRIIQVHSLVVTPEEDVHTWLKYASLCRKSKQLKLSHKTLVMLLGSDPSQNIENDLPYHNPHVTFAYTKHLWMDGKEQLAYDKLSRFVNVFKSSVSQKTSLSTPTQIDTNNRLLARCYMKLGLWMNKLQGLNECSINNILSYYEAATQYDQGSYKAWHSWAYANFKVIQTQKLALLSQKNSESGASAVPSELAKKERENQLVLQYAVPALKGFFRSINLSQGNSLQDTLRLLTLWFDYGQTAEVIDALNEGIRIIEINTWLQVIPQLIARIDTPRLLVGQLIHKLLSDIGKSHPQALVYPLTVASKSASQTRKNAANIILNSMMEHSPTLVDQAKMISEELIRVAILWHEQWHEGLEEASRLYFADKNIKGMFEILSPLHAMLERGPQTLKETSFNQAYGRELFDANEWCNNYKVSKNQRDLSQAWDLYYHVFRRISKQLPQLTSLELQYVSPKLLRCRNLELAVPGSYTPGQELIKISSIQTNLQVITSKQRPRKLCVRGSNGKEYMFLLKGHEDLRQDERVMQLFGLVNTLLLNDPDTFRRNLTIQRYAVIPLSTNSGLIGWVPHCDTLHVLIRDYREKQKTLINIEHRLMLRMAPDYEKLTLMQKVEVFEYALGLTKGDDLARLLWLKSPSSEVWFERRTNYTRSLATMSMVGYILGLGDRHPSNLMLDRMTGKILHIDFGDCFEVAMTREKFPEKIPFRLTRMLTNAMEVTGIEGTYRKTCESVMNVLRKNKDSLMAVLEAFVYDPLLNWRLLDTNEKSRRSKAMDSGGVDSLVDSGDDSSSDILSFAGNQRASTQRQITENTDENGQNYLYPAEATSKKAREIVDRVKQKLTGNDFNTAEPVDVQKQVDLLIQQATNNENLCQNYIGWCPFW